MTALNYTEEGEEMRCDGTPYHGPMTCPLLEWKVTVAEEDTEGKEMLEILWDRERRKDWGRRARTTMIGKEKR